DPPKRPASVPPGQRRPGSTPPRRPSTPAPANVTPAGQRQQVAKAPPAARQPEGGRYAPARPAAIFGPSPPPNSPPSSLFGEDLISDKSLDEVILSYLAEDLEPSDAKKKR